MLTGKDTVLTYALRLGGAAEDVPQLHPGQPPPPAAAADPLAAEALHERVSLPQTRVAGLLTRGCPGGPTGPLGTVDDPFDDPLIQPRR
jgi:hypothetical protein